MVGVHVHLVRAFDGRHAIFVKLELDVVILVDCSRLRVDSTVLQQFQHALVADDEGGLLLPRGIVLVAIGQDVRLSQSVHVGRAQAKCRALHEAGKDTHRRAVGQCGSAVDAADAHLQQCLAVEVAADDACDLRP